MANHISPDGKSRPCGAKPGNCKFPPAPTEGGGRPATTPEAYLAAITEQLDKTPAPTVPASITYPVPTQNAQYAILDLIDAADDEEALEELGFTMDDRDAAYAWVKDSSKVPADPKEALELISELLAVDYDEDEMAIDPDHITEAEAWTAEAKKNLPNAT